MTALLFGDEASLVVIHIGVTRAYMLREELFQITHDDVLSCGPWFAEPDDPFCGLKCFDGGIDREPQIFLREVRGCDRYVLGTPVFGRVIKAELQYEILRRRTPPERAVEQLLVSAAPSRLPLACMVIDLMADERTEDRRTA